MIVSLLVTVVHGAGRSAEGLDGLARQGEAEGNRAAGATHLQRRNEGLHLRFAARLQPGQREEPLHDIAQVLPGLIIASLCPEQARNAPIHVTAG